MKTVKLALLGTVILFICGCNWVALVSVSNSGVSADGINLDPRVSANGRYVTYESDATNLVAGDTNAKTDIFVRDVRNGTTRRVSVNSAGVQANGLSLDPSISDDGRYIAFWSNASNLVPNDTNVDFDIFVKDLDTGITSRVSVDSGGNEGNDTSVLPSLSGDGRFVSFESHANNLVAGDTNNKRDVFVHDRATGVTSRVNLGTAGTQGNDASFRSSISSDGRYVAFESVATNLVPGDLNARTDAFVHDRQTGITTRESLGSTGNEGDSHTLYSSISGNGQFVLFASEATNIVTGDTNNQRDVFVRDRTTGNITRVSVDSAGNQSNGRSTYPRISHDGRYVVFSSDATDLAGVDTNGYSDVFVHDRTTGVTSRVSLDALGAEANWSSPEASIAADGRYVVFVSGADNLVDGVTTFVSNVFIRAIPELAITSVVPNMLPIGTTTAVTITGTNFLPAAKPSTNAQLSNIVIVDENTITMDVTVPANATAGARHLSVNLFGTGPGKLNGSSAICSNCLTFF